MKYLLSLSAVRERSKIVGEAAEAGKLSHFDVHEEQLAEAADFVTSVIKVGRKIHSLQCTVIADGTSISAITVQTSSTPFPRMADGNTLKWATFPASPSFLRSGSKADVMTWRRRAA